MQSLEGFLEQRAKYWPRLADKELEECNDEQKKMIRGLEEQFIQMEIAQLREICTTCLNKWQFAKTYKTLRSDVRRTFADDTKSLPNEPPHVSRAMRQICLKGAEVQS